MNPPKDVQEKEQFRTLRQWIQEALWTSDHAAEVKQQIQDVNLMFLIML